MEPSIFRGCSQPSHGRMCLGCIVDTLKAVTQEGAMVNIYDNHNKNSSGRLKAPKIKHKGQVFKLCATTALNEMMALKSVRFHSNN